MKKIKNQAPSDDIRPEYDFSGAVRGKYYERFQQGCNLVLLDADVSAAFPTSVAVNQALRTLVSARAKSLRVIRRPPNPRRRPAKRMHLTGRAKPRRGGPHG